MPTALPSAQSQPLPDPSSEGAVAPVHQAGEVLLEFLAATNLGRGGQFGLLLTELAELAVATSSGSTSQAVSTAYLKEKLAPVSKKEPSAWMSPHWKRVCDEQPRWRDGLEEAASRLKRSFLPQLRKRQVSGGVSEYYLEAVRASTEARTVEAPVPTGGVRYTTESTTESAAWIRWFFRAGAASWSIRVRLGVLSVLVIGILLLAFLLLATNLSANQATQPLAFKDVWSLVIIASFAWILYELATPMLQLADLRIILAPEVLTKFKDHGVTLEIRSTGPDDERPKLVLAKYTAVCSKCEGTVEILEGGKSFPDRLIGRCRFSAREHVYSFDHRLRVGRPLH